MISATAVMADRQNFASNFVQKFGQNFSQFSRCLYVFSLKSLLMMSPTHWAVCSSLFILFYLLLVWASGSGDRMGL